MFDFGKWGHEDVRWRGDSPRNPRVYAVVASPDWLLTGSNLMVRVSAKARLTTKGYTEGLY